MGVPHGRSKENRDNTFLLGWGIGVWALKYEVLLHDAQGIIVTVSGIATEGEL